MRVLVTGAFGNVGASSLSELLAQGHTVRAFDLPTPINKRRAARHRNTVEVVWGDIRNRADVARAVMGQDAVVHLAFMLPPLSETQPDLARTVNVDGSRHLIAALQTLERPARLIFASSFSVYGDARHQKELMTADSPVQALNHYNQHKVTVEQMVRESGLTWCIVRLGTVLPTELGGGISPTMFDLPPDARQEFLHPRDAALAIANCLHSTEAWGKVLLLSGGKDCQLTYADMVNRTLEAMGIGQLPDAAFSSIPRQGGCWMDTSESQRILQYQRYTFDAYLKEVAARAGFRRHVLRLFSPLVRRYILRLSPHWKSRHGPRN